FAVRVPKLRARSRNLQHWQQGYLLLQAVPRRLRAQGARAATSVHPRRTLDALLDSSRRDERQAEPAIPVEQDRKSTRLNSSHVKISYAVFCLKKKKMNK